MSDRYAAIMAAHDDAALAELAAADSPASTEEIRAARAEISRRGAPLEEPSSPPPEDSTVAASPRAPKVPVHPAPSAAEVAEAAARAEEELTNTMRVLAAVAPGPAYLYARVLRAQGYTRQATALRSWSLAAIVIHVAIVVVGTLAMVLASG